MPRRQRPVGRLTQKPKDKKNISENKYRVLAENAIENTLWTHGEYKSFNEAKSTVDNLPHSNISYYIYSDLNRVLYNRKGITSG